MTIQRDLTKAFTLTELAIVLGVAGIILGAVWVAGDQVAQRQKVTKAVDELMHIVSSLRDLYGGKANPVVLEEDNLMYDGAVVVGSSSLTYVNGGIIPSDMLVAGIPANPWSTEGVMILAANAAGDATTRGAGVKIAFSNVPKSACIGLLTAVAGASRDRGLIAVWTDADPLAEPSGKITTFPVTASAAENNCQEPGSVGFSFLIVPRR